MWPFCGVLIAAVRLQKLATLTPVSVKQEDEHTGFICGSLNDALGTSSAHIGLLLVVLSL
jgi:hypothetical protein